MYISIANAAAYSVLGFAVVFLGLIMLMFVIWVLSKVVGGRSAKTAAPAPAVSAPPVAAPAVQGKLAPGSAGEIKLHSVPDKEAAMIMAIVANQLGKPLNELRFLSIKEVK